MGDKEEEVLNQQLLELSEQQAALPRYVAPKPVKVEDPSGKRMWALKKERESRDDDDMAMLAPGRRGHIGVDKGMTNMQMKAPDWFEAHW
eukprot:CAMPEP_0114351490 /NCGR_PEP_ID=MMETSP0101-20121206/17230_1 /TAXON_ID=38822 ORGANISM="Pteridomonas danica, Strain PT" /NCGR_SAMPLE_ID=MMETSP0101 /ASSEMBLY_ACC=CAM_ASM_000211 /LENGTH=89 /DNA_ID=CAMNT_0001491407 /DNA_START=351 /DNA_END=617 /DNA_ORIENTATION=+